MLPIDLTAMTLPAQHGKVVAVIQQPLRLLGQHSLKVVLATAQERLQVVPPLQQQAGPKLLQLRNLFHHLLAAAGVQPSSWHRAWCMVRAGAGLQDQNVWAKRACVSSGKCFMCQQPAGSASSGSSAMPCQQVACVSSVMCKK
jgi:hypothetical protein